jgi:hypothetical protein
VEAPVESRAGLPQFQRQVKRGLVLRFGFLIADLAVLLWLLVPLNAMRLYTIRDAPSYVPQSLDQYWMALGAGMATALVRSVEPAGFAWRTRETVMNRFPGALPLDLTAIRTIPPPPPDFNSSGR